MLPIFVVDDDPDEYILVQKAFAQNQVPNPVVFLRDGEELLDCLSKKGPYANDPDAGKPALILLDLNMPRMDGLTALKLIKSSEEYKSVPVVVLSTSCAPEDISMVNELGADSYICKPPDFETLVRAIGSLKNHWIEPLKPPSVESILF